MVAQKVRKPRGPRGRGLRSTSGCLTCRSRRLKCDEKRPICSNCVKSSRPCTYPTAASAIEGCFEGEAAIVDDVSLSLDRSESTLNDATNHHDQLRDSSSLPHEGSDLNDAHFSPSTTASFAPGTASYKWYDLIARDAWRNPDGYQFLTSHGSRWSFNSGDIPSITIPQSPHSHIVETPLTQASTVMRVTSENPNVGLKHPWNTTQPIMLETREADYLQHYVDVVGPLLDLFDTRLHFTTEVLRLAFSNEGLLKSILALSATHRASCGCDDGQDVVSSSLLTENHASSTKSHREMALQYYYETLGYLSQSMRIMGYADSQEILANSVLISWYEAFESDSSPNWERHLKGVFWIQRSRNSNGESIGLPGAVWWTWLRQDIWAAFRNARKTLTIWVPTKSLEELDAEELARRVLYLQAKAVSFAATESHRGADFEQRMTEGEELLDALEAWYQILPAQFTPLPVSVIGQPSSAYKVSWINPPTYAAAMQTYYSAKILVLLNQPSRGGRQEFHARQKTLDSCIRCICGIAASPNARYPPLAMINAQALFIAGQSLLDPEHQGELLKLLRISLNAVDMPSKTLESELQHAWGMTQL